MYKKRPRGGPKIPQTDKRELANNQHPGTVQQIQKKDKLVQPRKELAGLKSPAKKIKESAVGAGFSVRAQVVDSQYRVTLLAG